MQKVHMNNKTANQSCVALALPGLLHRSQPRRDSVYQGKGKFGKLGGGKSCSVFLWFHSVLRAQGRWLKCCGYHLSICNYKTQVGEKQMTSTYIYIIQSKNEKH